MKKNNTKILEPAKELIKLSPDFYLRYYLGFEIIKKTWGKKSCQILDVGGRGGILGDFIRNENLPYKLTVLDILPDDKNSPTVCDNYIQADFLKEKINGNFDVVTSFDVLEHIEEKEKFLAKFLKLGKIAILAAPFESSEVREAERLANNFFLKYTGKDHPWLKEHFEAKLPKKKWFEDFLKKKSYGFFNLSSNCLPNWLFFVLPNFLPAFIEVNHAELQDINRYYNRNFLNLGDLKHPGYRDFYIISKKQFPDFSLSSRLDYNKQLAFEKMIIDFLSEAPAKLVLSEERLKATVQSQQQTLAQKEEQVTQLTSEREQLTQEMAQLQATVQSQQQKLKAIYSSLGWELINKYRGIKDSILRKGTRRRRIYDLVLKGIKTSLKGPKHLPIIEQHKAIDRFPIHVNDPTNAIVLVSHDARTGGASLLALHLAKTMREKFNKELIIILLQGGVLEDNFRQYGQVFCLQLRHFGFLDAPDRVDNLIAALKDCGLRYCILNTVVSGCLVPLFKKHGFYTVSLVHELPTSIEMLEVRESVKNIVRRSDKIVFAAEFVKQQFVDTYGAGEEKTVIKPQGIYSRAGLVNKVDARQKLRHRIGGGKESFIFLGCGHADLRKGLDLFIQVAGLVLKQVPHEDVHFLWVGGIVDKRLKAWAEHDIEKLNIKGRVHFMDYVSDVVPIFVGADAFLLTSREDPLPLVLLEAIDAGLPVTAFKGAGGAPEVLDGGRGIAVPYLDTAAMADAAAELLLNKDKRKDIAEKAQPVIKEKYDFEKYAGFLLDLLGNGRPAVKSMASQDALKPKTISVIVPNYNHEKYLTERLSSIIGQTYKPYEIIFLDDASTDKSVEVARRILGGSGIKFSIIENNSNEGVFNRWIKGFQLAEGELVWTAEADDFCEQGFLEKVVPRFGDDEVTLAYTQSQIVDEKSEKIDYSYTSYTADLSQDKWNLDYCQSGALEINDGLAIKNTIPNASAVVMRKSALTGIEDTLHQFKICGDWFTYAYVLRKGKVSFCHEALNYHRRHSQSNISRSEKTELFYKEILAVQEFILKNYIVRSAVCEQMKIHLIAEYRRLGCQGQESRDIMRNLGLAGTMRDLARLCKKRTLKQGQKHRIMVIIPDLEFGGGQLFGIRLANFLSNTNDVVLYNARPYLINRGIKDTISADVRLYQDNGNPDEAAQIIDTYGIDAVISNVWWSDKLAYLAVKDKKVRWVLVMHGCYEALVANPHWDGDFQRIVRPLLLRADRIVNTADKNLTALESLGLSLKDKLIKINNGFLKPDRFTAKIRTELGVNDNDFVFGLISRAIPEKGWEQAILATVKLNKVLENRRAHLFLIGEGRYAEELKGKYAKDETIHFVGFQSNLAEWIAMFDAGLLPSYFQSESQPLIIIEFIAHNKPVIATDIGEIHTMLIRGKKKAGILIPIVAGTVKVDDLFLAMKQLAFNEGHMYDRLRANCEELFQPYDMKTCAEAYISLLEEKE